jgi:capsular polysaccharide export protein
MGFEAMILGKECVCFGMPFYAGWGACDTRAVCPRRARKRSVEEIFAAAYILYTRYRDPYTLEDLDIIGTIKRIMEIRQFSLRKKAYFFGFSYWKHGFIKPFFEREKFSELHFINPIFTRNYYKLALKKGLDNNSLIYIWGKKPFPLIEEFASAHDIPLRRVEDGFLRSVALGSDLTRPYSLVVDRMGLYFDASAPSELEMILQYHDFTADELRRGREVRDFLARERISKYNINPDAKVIVPDGRKVIFVVGQVDDDASIRYGGGGMTSLSLLGAVRQAESDASIIYKPHPDGSAKNRRGATAKDASAYADLIIADAVDA